MLYFLNDYSSGAHPEVMEALCRTNEEKTVGYGLDPYCEAAVETIRGLCGAPGAAVHFLMGGTQANKTAIGAFLRPYEAAVAADSGHICVHETGAVEQDGHRILSRAVPDGKVTPAMVREIAGAHSGEHMVVPKLVYISNTTELGTVYTRGELAALREVCDELGLYLYCDGARLGCAMDAGGTVFADYGRYTDAFTIGGTKNGLLFGEALVIVRPELQPYFRHCMKQQGAVLAKGRLLGVQFETALKDGLYMRLAGQANAMAKKLTAGLKKKWIPFMVPSESNQIFPILSKETAERLAKDVAYEVWGPTDSGVCVRFVTAWDTSEADVNALLELL